MFKFIKDFVYTMILLMTIEMVLYKHDYSEVMVLKEYIENDFNKELKSCKGENYDIYIFDEKYSIIYYRKSIFNIKFLGKIEYHGII